MTKFPFDDMTAYGIRWDTTGVPVFYVEKNKLDVTIPLTAKRAQELIGVDNFGTSYKMHAYMREIVDAWERNP